MIKKILTLFTVFFMIFGMTVCVPVEAEQDNAAIVTECAEQIKGEIEALNAGKNPSEEVLVAAGEKLTSVLFNIAANESVDSEVASGASEILSDIKVCFPVFAELFEDETAEAGFIDAFDTLYSITVDLESVALGKGSPVLAEEKEGSVDNFVALGEALTFTDVTADKWYYETVSNVSALGIINGKGDGTFAPDDSITMAETMTLAAKMNAIYFDRTDVLESFVEEYTLPGRHWAMGYIKYCEQFGVPTAYYHEIDMDAPRLLIGQIFYYALPEEAYTAINDYEKAPEKFEDWDDATPGLFAAGIMIGDESGFRLESCVTRAETAALIYRIACPEERIVVE